MLGKLRTFLVHPRCLDSPSQKLIREVFFSVREVQVSTFVLLMRQNSSDHQLILLMDEILHQLIGSIP